MLNSGQGFVMIVNFLKHEYLRDKSSLRFIFPGNFSGFRANIGMYLGDSQSFPPSMERGNFCENIYDYHEVSGVLDSFVSLGSHVIMKSTQEDFSYVQMYVPSRITGVFACYISYIDDKGYIEVKLPVDIAGIFACYVAE